MTWGGRWSRNPHHPFGHPSQQLVCRIKGFECRTPLVIHPLVEPAGHQPLLAVDFRFQSRVPGDLPLPLQPVLQVYLILNAIRYWRLWVITWATLGSRCRQRLQNGTREVLNAHVDCQPIVQFQKNLIFQVSLEVGPVSVSVIRAIQGVLKG